MTLTTTIGNEVQIGQLEGRDFVHLENTITRCLNEVSRRDYPDDVIDRMLPEYTTNNLPMKLGPDFCLVARKDGVAIGTISVERLPDGITGYAHTGFVRPDFQGQGIGTQLITQMFEICKAAGLKSLRGNSSITALQFNMNRGWVPIERQTREVGGESILIEKIL